MFCIKNFEFFFFWPELSVMFRFLKKKLQSKILEFKIGFWNPAGKKSLKAAFHADACLFSRRLLSPAGKVTALLLLRWKVAGCFQAKCERAGSSLAASTSVKNVATAASPFHREEGSGVFFCCFFFHFKIVVEESTTSNVFIKKTTNWRL